MRLTRDGLRLSPSDLNNFLACEHRTWLDLRRARGEIALRKAPRPDAELLAERGRQHEAAFLQELVDTGHDVAEIDADAGAETAAAATIDAMRAGREVVYQAAFADDGWHGYADFLVRVEEPSALGSWSYEAYDAKLATHPKPYFIFQLLFYTEQIARIQGRWPENMRLVLGDGQRPAFRPRDFLAYATRVRERYLEGLGAYGDGAQPPYPYPVAHCDYCDWWAHCRDKRRADDHLSLVAFLSRAQGMRLEAAGVHTVAALGTLAEDTSVPRVPGATLGALRQQARLQLESRGRTTPLREFLEPEPERGFARLPPPSPGDVFFDIEGDPYWGDEGLEYLLGTVTLAEPDYRPLWAHDRDGERAIFEHWVDWVSDRLARHPDLHVYHYNHYEPTTVKKLMARYGTREAEVDDLLRRKVFVDLYTVVRQAMRVGAESYSLKSIEELYPLERDADITQAGGSILAYQEWVESGDPAKLDAIAQYNRDDCRSTRALRDWLQEEKHEAERRLGVSIDALEPPAPRVPSEETAALLAQVAALERDLTAGQSEDVSALTGEERARRLAADVLSYHRREAKPEWWAYFDRLGQSADGLRDEDSEAIGDLTPALDLTWEDAGRSWLHPLRYPPQQHKLGPGDAVDPEREKSVTIARMQDDRGLLWIKRAKASADRPLPRSLIPGQPIPQRAQELALRRLAARIRDHGTAPCSTLDAAADLLARRSPRLVAGTPPLQPGPVELKRLHAQVAGLDDSVLFIQGPPGSGKTWTGARLVARLLRDGRRVGVTATAHKAIHNLLDDLERHAAEERLEFRGLKKASGGDESHHESRHITSSTDNADFPPADPQVRLVAGTAWLWAREEMRESVDVLFVDEAGQVSLADVLAMAGAARSVVLLGDPQQLAHVSHGTHPRGSGASVLEHTLGDAATVAPAEGVFLDHTYRMHPDVCRFVSNAMYDGRLQPVDACARQRVDADGELSGAGVSMLAVEHEDNRQTAPQEAERVAGAVQQLLDTGWFTDCAGSRRRLTLDDVLVVAPYNAQVRCLRERLPAGARVGTVDKFQGQQAPVVFFSMTSSSGEDVPRGMDFLFSRNRLNVAVSRAQALAVIVCSPRLLWARCNTVEQMRLVNALCEFADEAAAQRVLASDLDMDGGLSLT